MAFEVTEIAICYLSHVQVLGGEPEPLTFTCTMLRVVDCGGCFCQGPSKSWVHLESNLASWDLRALLWLSSSARKLISSLPPLTQHTLTIQDCMMSNTGIGPMTPFFANPSFLPVLGHMVFGLWNASDHRCLAPHRSPLFLNFPGLLSETLLLPSGCNSTNSNLSCPLCLLLTDLQIDPIPTVLFYSEALYLFGDNCSMLRLLKF